MNFAQGEKYMNEQNVKALGEAKILGLMVRYSTPTILATIVGALYNIVDRIFVGRALGEDAIAAITVCFAPAMLFLAIAMTISQGTATMLSIKLGEKKSADAEKFLGQAVMLFIVFSAAVAAIAIPFMDEILIFFGATPKILPDAKMYFTIIVAGQIFEQISYGLNGQVRAEGRPSIAMTTMLIGAGVNVSLDWLFLFPMGMGVEGAAYATVIGEAVASLWVLRFYFCGKSYLKIRAKNLRVHWGSFKTMVSAGSPSLIMQGLASLAILIFVRQARSYGDEGAIAVVGVTMTATMLMFLPIVGLSMGIQPIIGYNWGARNYARVKETFLKALYGATIVCSVCFIFLQLFPGLIFSLFLGPDSHVLGMGERALRILTLVTPLIGVNIVTSGYFQSVKRPKFAIFITTLRQLLLLVPMFVILPKFFGLDGVWASYPVSDFLSWAVTMYFTVREVRRLDRKEALRLAADK